MEITIVKLIIGFAGLWLLTRVLGKKEISNLTPFDFVSSLLLSDIVGETLYAEETKYVELITAFAVWFTLSYIFEKVTQYAKRLRGPLEGKPSIVVQNGEVDLEQMKKNKLDFEQLQMMLRQKDIFSMSEVAYAIFETNGSLSVMKNPDNDAVERGDLNLPKEKPHLSYILIEAGEIDEKYLELIGKDKSWLMQELQKQGYKDPNDVVYAEWKEGRGLLIMRRNDDL